MENSNKKQIISALENSPYWSLLGFKVSRMEEGMAEIYLPIKENLMQIFSIMHGGAAASLLDAAGAVALFSEIDFIREAVTTVELKINYLNPVSIEETGIKAHGKVVKKGRSISVCEVGINSDSGKNIAVGLATYAIIQRNYY